MTARSKAFERMTFDATGRPELRQLWDRRSAGEPVGAQFAAALRRAVPKKAPIVITTSDGTRRRGIVVGYEGCLLRVKVAVNPASRFLDSRTKILIVAWLNVIGWDPPKVAKDYNSED